MLAFHNDAGLKDFVLAELARHREAERLLQGHGYWEDGKGCAVGCTLEAVRVRAVLADEIKHLTDIPKNVVLTLARDLETIVAQRMKKTREAAAQRCVSAAGRALWRPRNTPLQGRLANALTGARIRASDRAMLCRRHVKIRDDARVSRTARRVRRTRP